MPLPFPTTLEDVDAAWMTSVLRDSGALPDDATIGLTGSEPVGFGEAYASVLHRLTVAGAAGFPASLILKLPVHGGLRPMLDAIGVYRREVVFYKKLAAACPLRTPRCYYAAMAEHGTDFAILMEDLAPLRSADQLAGLSIAQAGRMMDELAAFHAWSWEHPRLAEYSETFPAIDSAAGRIQQHQFLEGFSSVWPVWSQRARDVLTPSAREVGARFSELMPLFLAELSTPRTFTLGDLRADNVFFADGDRPFVVDFQLVQQECGTREVAYLLSQSLPVETRHEQDQRLLHRYWSELCTHGVRGYEWDQAWRQYRLAVAYNLLYPVLASLAWDQQGQRGRDLLLEMTRRASAAIEACDSLAVLPGGPSGPP
jgi:hypothetical protein